MAYRINVSRAIPGKAGRYLRFFSTDRESTQDLREMANVYHSLLTKYPEPEYKVIMTEWNTCGTAVPLETIANAFEPIY